MKLYFVAPIDDVKRIVKEGFPSEPETVGPLYLNEYDAMNLTKAENIHYVEITAPGKKPPRCKRGTAWTVKTSDLNGKCKLKFPPKFLSSSLLGIRTETLDDDPPKVQP